MARKRHVSALLASGRVLVAGGVDDGGAPVEVAEIFDPATGTFTPVAHGKAPLPGDARAIPLPSGETLLVGDLVAYRYDEAADEIALAGTAPTHAFGGAVLPGGRIVVCGLDHCEHSAVGAAPGTLLDGAQRDGHSLTVTAGGDVLALGLTPTYRRHAVTVWASPRGAPRPTVTDAPAQMAPGEVVTLKGTRFARVAAVGADALPPRTDVVPRVVFLPEAHGAPLDADVVSFTDTSLTFRAPRTPFTGGGALHVVVGGVPSEARFVDLVASGQGDPCTADRECATGHCVEGVCCDGACEVGCSSCRAARTAAGEGTCAPVVEGGAARSGCEATGNACGTNGLCDGAGRCALAAEGTPCGDAPGGACLNGACVGSCTSNVDCPAGSLCLPSGHCDAPIDAGPVESGCAMGGGGRGRGAATGFGIVAAVVALALGRRRRAPRQKS